MLTIIAIASFLCALVVAATVTAHRGADAGRHHVNHDILASGLAVAVIEISMVAFFGPAVAEYCGAVIIPMVVALRGVQTIAVVRAA